MQKEIKAGRLFHTAPNKQFFPILARWTTSGAERIFPAKETAEKYQERNMSEEQME